MLQIYFTLITINEEVNSYMIDDILEKYLAAQLKTSVYFIYKKFKNSKEKQNLKLLQKLFPDEISVGD